MQEMSTLVQEKRCMKVYKKRALSVVLRTLHQPPVQARYKVNSRSSRSARYLFNQQAASAKWPDLQPFGRLWRSCDSLQHGISGPVRFKPHCAGHRSSVLTVRCVLWRLLRQRRHTVMFARVLWTA